MSPPKYSSAYWRELADDAHARAADVMGSSTSVNVQLWMLEIAHIYDWLVDQEAEVERGQSLTRRQL
jgi:hypothetical protein